MGRYRHCHHPILDVTETVRPSSHAALRGLYLDSHELSGKAGRHREPAACHLLVHVRAVLLCATLKVLTYLLPATANLFLPANNGGTDVALSQTSGWDAFMCMLILLQALQGVPVLTSADLPTTPSLCYLMPLAATRDHRIFQSSLTIGCVAPLRGVV